MNIPQPISEIFKALSSQYEVYYVGGCVRDALLGKQIHDYDCTTNATPDQMKEALASFQIVSTGEKHGTLTIIHQKQSVEITTYRTEKEYILHRKPQSVVFSNRLEDDLIRRDFTINALIYHPEKGILDYVGGLEDLKYKIIRAIGQAEKRFEEDALRILRAIRFSLQLDFTIEKNTKKAIIKTKHYLAAISKERCRDELIKILKYPQALSRLKEYDLCNFFMIHSEVDEDLLESCQDDVLQKLAILYQTKEEAEKTMKAFHFSNKEIHDVTSFYTLSASLTNEKKALRKLIYQLNGNTIQLKRILHFNQIATSLLDQILKEHDYFLQLNLTGKDCLALNIEPNQIGTILSRCLEYCFEDISHNDPILLKNYIIYHLQTKQTNKKS